MNHTIIIDADSLAFICSKDTLASSVCYLNEKIQNIINRCGSTQTTHLSLFLSSGKETFRHLNYPKIEGVPKSGYKGNRVYKEVPEFMYQLKQYMISQYHAQTFYYYEADDACSLSAEELRKKMESYIVAHIDSDLNMIPGKHYNYKTDKNYDVSIQEAEKELFKQILTGAAKDNIKGLSRFGKAKWELYENSINNLEDVEKRFQTFNSGSKKTPKILGKEEGTKEYLFQYMLTKLLTEVELLDEIPLRIPINQ